MDPLTYDELFDAVRIEKAREALQELDKDFYTRAYLYIEDKKRFIDLRMSNDNFSKEEIEKEKRLLENAKKLLKELYWLRERKILSLAMYKARTGSDRIDRSTMLPTEQELFEELSKLLERYKEKIISKRKEKEEEKPDLDIEILEDIPSFVDSNGERYGPFNKGDIVELPPRISEILLKRGVARRLGDLDSREE